MLNFGTFAAGNTPCGPVFANITSDCGSGYLSGFSNTVLMTEKTAVFAPIPTAITRIAMIAKVGDLARERNAKRKSRHASSIQGGERYSHTRSRMTRGL